MSRPDFDFSKYVEVPDAWVENALKIPDTAKNQPKALPIRRYVTAASIVLVIALGISVYFLFGNKIRRHKHKKVHRQKVIFVSEKPL